MPEIIYIDDKPSQRFPIRIGNADYDFLFMYNQIADRWSYTIFESGKDCPVIAGGFIYSGLDLIERLGLDYYLMVTDRPGVSRETFNWFDRLTKPIGSTEIPATYLVLLTKAEAKEIFSRASAKAFPVC